MSAITCTPRFRTRTIPDLAGDLANLLAEFGLSSDGVPDHVRQRAADLVEALRCRLAPHTERDPRSLFDLDDRLASLMDQVQASLESGTEVPAELANEIDLYLDTYRSKVDRIASYCQWQQSVAAICGAEAERLQQRKRAAERRVERLKNYLLAFMISRGLKKLEGEESSISRQANSSPSLRVDDPTQIPSVFKERRVRFSKAVLVELIGLLPQGDVRAGLEAELSIEAWEVSESAVRAELVGNREVAGARLETGEHVRIR